MGHGFTLSGGVYTTLYYADNISFDTGTIAHGINDSGAIVGVYGDIAHETEYYGFLATPPPNDSIIYADYGSSGTWKYNGTWTKLTPANPEGMAASGSLLYADYGSSGTWMYNGNTWSKLTPADAQNMAASGSFLYVDYGSSGTWMYNGSTWMKLTPADPEGMAVP